MLLQATTVLPLKDILINTVKLGRMTVMWIQRQRTHNPLLSIYARLLPDRGYVSVVLIAEVCQCCCVIWWKSFCALAVLVLWNSPVCQSYDFEPALNTIVISKQNVLVRAMRCSHIVIQSQRRSCTHNLIWAFNNLCPLEVDVFFLRSPLFYSRPPYC